jgi:hypothetical protein
MSRPSPRATAPPYLLLFINDPLKEEEGLFALGFYFGLWRVFRSGLWLWAFGCGKLLEGKRSTKGKKIAKGKLLKGKEWLKRA